MTFPDVRRYAGFVSAKCEDTTPLQSFVTLAELDAFICLLVCDPHKAKELRPSAIAGCTGGGTEQISPVGEELKPFTLIGIVNGSNPRASTFFDVVQPHPEDGCRFAFLRA